jgi:hypothetical protein
MLHVAVCVAEPKKARAAVENTLFATYFAQNAKYGAPIDTAKKRVSRSRARSCSSSRGQILHGGRSTVVLGWTAYRQYEMK